MPESGGSAVFRYVSSENGFSKVTIESKGKGKISVFLSEMPVAEINVISDGATSSAISVPGGCYELRLEFTESENLRVDSITLEDAKG